MIAFPQCLEIALFTTYYIVLPLALHSALSDAPAYGCTKLTFVGQFSSSFPHAIL